MSHSLDILRCAALLSCSPGLCACKAPTPHALVLPSDSHVVYHGRFDRREAGEARFAWPATQIEVFVSGRFLRARLSDQPFDPKSGDSDRLLVLVDDRPPVTLKLESGLHLYPLAEDLGPGRHRVLLWKRTDINAGTVGFHGFELAPDGSVLRPDPAPSRLLYFVGDSITAGYGVEAPAGPCPPNARPHNSYLAYGAVAARELRARYVAIAAGGRGVARNADGSTAHTLPEIYDRVLPYDEHSELVLATEPSPDAFVVNLGTNDFGVGVPDGSTLIRAYRAFVERLRARHPESYIFLVLPPMLDEQFPQPRARSLMRRWLTILWGQLRVGENGHVDVVELAIDPGEALGCDGHPSAATHQRLGREIAARIRARLHW